MEHGEAAVPLDAGCGVSVMSQSLFWGVLQLTFGTHSKQQLWRIASSHWFSLHLHPVKVGHQLVLTAREHERGGEDDALVLRRKALKNKWSVSPGIRNT